MKKQKEEKSKVKIPVKTKPKVKALADNSAEQKIKEAAKRLFTQKGYSATKTRDIAAEAGINLALLNYYFRSKEKLFDIIMMENLQQFAMGILTIMMDNEKKLDEKIEILVDNYIDMLSANPDLPFFVLNEMRKSTPHLPINIETVIGPIRAQFMEKLRKEGNEGKEINVNPFHIIANPNLRFIGSFYYIGTYRLSITWKRIQTGKLIILHLIHFHLIAIVAGYKKISPIFRQSNSARLFSRFGCKQSFTR